MASIYLIRHGQAAFGAADYDQLSPLGLEQGRVLGESLARRLPTVERVISGSMKRHRQTRDACLAAMRRELRIDESADLNEYDHVEVLDRFMDRRALGEALNAATDRKRAFEAWFIRAMERWQSGEHDAEYLETWPMFRARCLRGLDQVLQGLNGSDTALVFTSGGVITVIAQQLLEFPMSRFGALNWRLVNGGISKLNHGSRGLTLSTLNEHAHFEIGAAELLTYR